MHRRWVPLLRLGTFSYLTKTMTLFLIIHICGFPYHEFAIPMRNKGLICRFILRLLDLPDSILISTILFSIINHHPSCHEYCIITAAPQSGRHHIPACSFRFTDCNQAQTSKFKLYFHSKINTKLWFMLDFIRSLLSNNWCKRNCWRYIVLGVGWPRSGDKPLSEPKVSP